MADAKRVEARETDNVIRDVLALPERERLKLIEEVRQDFAEGGRQLPSDEMNEQMSNAIETFDKVAEHLGYEDDLAKLLMKMKSFDAAPFRVRDGLKARQLARVFGSWHIVKQAAVGEPLTPTPSQRLRRRQFTKERTRGRRTGESLQEWLATDPPKTSMKAYDRWKNERNASIGDDEFRYLAANSIYRIWGRRWSELVAEAKAGTLTSPLIQANDPLAAERSREADTEKGEPLAVEAVPPADLDFDSSLIARRLREGRAASGLSQKNLAKLSELSEASVAALEDGVQGERLTFRTVLRLSRALGVPIDFFASPDGRSGLPPRTTSKQG